MTMREVRGESTGESQPGEQALGGGGCRGCSV